MQRLLSNVKKIFSNKASIMKSIYYSFKYLPLDQARYLPIVVAKGVQITGSGKLKISSWEKGDSTSIYIGGRALNWMPSERKTPTMISLQGTLYLSKRFYFGSGGGIEVAPGAVAVFGDGFNATAKCTIVCRNTCTFGDNVLISWDTLIMDTDQHSIYQSDGTLKNISAPVTIGDHVWISSKVTVLKGTEVAAGSVVGCNSVVSGKFSQRNILIAGIPAKALKSEVNWSIDC